MADSAATTDYYTVLQVHPSADQEIIEAAYRQLMKKHHPDVAGIDARLAAQYHQRAKLINQAHSVLSDPVQRRRYDAMRSFGRYGAASPPPPRPEARDSQNAGNVESNDPPTGSPPPGWAEAEEPRVDSGVGGPFAALSAAYYLLPGAYEWERGHGQELLATCLLPPAGVAAFALATGRLTPWVGHSMASTLLAWGVVLLFLLPSWSSLPRLAMAGLPSLLMMSGVIDTLLRQASVPNWLAWLLLGFLSLVLSARLYLFAVLPTLGICWLLTRLG